MRICFVCSGNICRSPTAEVVLRQMADAAGVELQIDSAGTGSWHAGDDMDGRSRSTLDAAGYRYARHCAKQFTPADFADRDLVVALDTGHRDVLWWLAAETADPESARAKIVLLRSYESDAGDDLDVPDPYYGGGAGFDEVLAKIERGCAGLLQTLVSANQQLDSPPL